MKRRYAPIPAAPAWLLEIDAQERARQRERYPRVDPGPDDLADLVRLYWERLEDEIRSALPPPEPEPEPQPTEADIEAAEDALVARLEQRRLRRRERILGTRAILETLPEIRT